MLPIALALASFAVAASVALLVLRSRPARTAPSAVEADAPRPRSTVLKEAVPARATISGEVARPTLPRPARDSANALDALDALLAELESTTVRIDGADALDDASVAELEGLAARLEAAAESFAAR